MPDVPLVALDVGQSGVRTLLRAPDGEWRATAGGIAEPLAAPGAPERVAARLVGIVRALGPIELDAIGIGLSGFDTPGADVLRIAQGLMEATGARSVTIASDVVAWHLAAFGGGAGVVAAVGTGSVALAADGAGRCARADGWGHLLGDDASGFCIGRAGLASALRALDGRGGSERLLDLATRRFGDGPSIAAMIHAAALPVATVASFAPDVGAAAEAGDDEARAIWDGAGRALGRMILGAWRHAFPAGEAVDVGVVGSLAQAGDRLLGPCARQIAPYGLLAAVRDVDPVDGAARLAAGEGAGAYPGLMVAVERLRHA